MRSWFGLASILLLTACGASPGQGPALAAPPVSDAAVALADWENDWTAAELDTWHEGVVVDAATGGTEDNPGTLPVAGVKVELLLPPPFTSLRPLTVAASVETDSAGRFRVGPSPAGNWLLRVSKPGFATVWLGEAPNLPMVGLMDPPAGPVRRIGLRAATEVPGTALGRDGRPVAGVKLVASSTRYREEMTTDAEGRFVAHAPQGNMLIQSEDGAVLADPLAVKVEGTGPRPPVGVSTRRIEPVRGTVTDMTGAPAAAAVVLCVESPSNRTRTGRDGRFELPALPHHHLAAFSATLGWRVFPVPRAGDMHLWLEPSAGMAGRVTDREGRPLADVRLYGVVIGYNGVFERVVGPRSGADGSFDFSWLPRAPRGVANPVRLFARRRGFGESGIVTLAADRTAAEQGAAIRLLGAREVKGRALTGDGRPVVGELVTATWGHWDGGITPREVEALSVMESAVTHTDSEGGFRFQSLPLGLHAKVRCVSGAAAQEAFIDPLPPEGTLEFRFLGGLAIAGRATDAAGNAPEGRVSVEVLLLDTPGTELIRSAPAGEGGTFRFEDLPPGRYQVNAQGDQYDLRGGGVWSAGTEDVLVRLGRSATVVVRLAFDGGTAPDVPLRFSFAPVEGGAQEFRRTIDAGRGGEPVELRGVYPGPRRLEISGGVWRGFMEKIEVADGASLVLDAPVKRTLRVAAKLTAPDGTALGRKLVVLVPVPPTAGRQEVTTSGDDGSLDLTGLAPGRWRVQADLVGWPQLRREFEVKDGDNPPLALSPPPAGSLEVTVRRPDGLPMAGAVVVLRDGEGAALNAWGEGAASLTSHFTTGPDGRVVIEGVRAGAVKVEVRVAAATLGTRDAEVAAGRRTSIEVQ